MSTYTDTLGLEEITPGDQAGLWGNTTNNNLALIDQAVTGVTPISFTGLSGTVKTLESSNGALDEARAAVLNITGIATGANTVVVPNKQKTYLVRNNTGQNVTFRTATPTATYAVEAGNSILVFCDGNNNVFTGIASPSVGTLSVSAGGTGATTFTAGFVKSPGGTTALTSAAAVALGSADVSGTLAVSNGGTGAGTFTAGSLLVGNGTSNFGVLVGGGVGQVATWNGSTWTAATPAASGGTVTSVSGTGSGLGFSLSGTVTSSGSLTLTAPSAATLNTNLGTVTLTGTQTVSGAKTFSSTITCSSGDVVRSGSGFSALQSNAVTMGNASTGIFNTGSANFGFQSGGSSVLFIAAGTGSVTNVSGSYTAISDQRIKENIVPARSYLADLQKLKVVNYNLIGKQDKYLGLVAQDVQKVMPGLVDENTPNDSFPNVENLLSVKYSVLVPMLLQAIQELNAKLDAQAAEIAALKGA